MAIEENNKHVKVQYDKSIYPRLYAKGDLVLVVEPDYLPDLEVFYFQWCLYPMKSLHPKSMYTLPHRGVNRGGTPSAGSGGAIPLNGVSGGKRAPSRGLGAKPPKQKLPCKSIL
jgi:hypothetical protein